MHYSRFQKWLSSFLIFSLLFLQTFEVPMLNSTRAEAKTNADVISFIVDDDLYSGAVKSKVLQYAKDIQAYLPNTRVVIFPVQKTANPFSIASINEKLFYEGDGEGLSRLIGTILIGEVPLPVVHKEGKAFMSVYPYVDFDDKSFVYDQNKKTYEYTTKTLTDEKPEVWHSVIRPNTGDESKNRDELVTFFNKTHDFYNKQGLFSSENTPQEPRVFYMDTVHDQEASSYESWRSYNLYLENIEDITYRRFNKSLAKRLYDASQSFYNLDSTTIKDPSIKAILDVYSGSTMDISKAPDISTKDIIEKSVKRFFEVFNGKYMGDILRYVHNAGRYGDTDVRVDGTPVVIAKQDLFMGAALKDANTSLEWAIDTLLREKLAEPLKIAVSYKTDGKLYKNYFFGQEASSITDMKQCTIVRGSTLKVEANRGYNPKNSENDVKILQSDLPNGQCFSGNTPATQSYWGGNSPLNFDLDKMKLGQIILKSHVYKNFIKPAYDIGGSRELESDSPLHIATPLDCLDNNMILQKDFNCNTGHETVAFADYRTYEKELPSGPCTVSKLELDGQVVKQSGDWCGDVTDVVNHENVYSFKTLSGSIMEHKSPTDEEYGEELKNMTTPSLPSDHDRYVDYLDKNMAYQKIVYPNFFRIVLARTELNYSGATNRIKELLDQKSAEIRALGGDIDLYKILSSDEKALNVVVEWVIWNNVKNDTLKYSSSLERKLDRDGEAKISADGKKNDYEIAYLGAPGDAKNMYIQVDPQSKAPLPSEITDIMDRVNNYHGLIDGSNIAGDGGKADFKCGPPEGVPIWQWIPAIFCWIGTVIPPTISGGSCGGSGNSTIGSSMGGIFGGKWVGSSPFATPANALDGNRNGVLDGYELIGDGQLVLHKPEKIFGYGESVPLEAELMKDGKTINIDDFNAVTFDIKKLTLIAGADGTAPKVVYDKNGDETIANIANIDPYITFAPMEIRAQQGLARYGFSTKNSDIDIVFEAHIFTRDRYGVVIVDKKSEPVTISVRSDRISVQGKVKNGDLPFTSGSVIEAGNPNGILFNLRKVTGDGVARSDSLPYTLRVYDDIDNTLIRGPINVTKNEYLFRDESLLNKSGTYRFEFIDAKGIKGMAVMTALPALPQKIEVTPASNIFIAGQKTTVLVRVLDSFGNLAQGEVYKLNGSISWGAEFVGLDGRNAGSTLSKDIVEWYASFDITNAKTSDDMKLSFRIDKANISSETIRLRSIEYAKISMDVENRERIIAGKESHTVHVKVLDKDNRVLDGYNGVMSLDFPKLSGTLSAPFVRIVNGASTGITLTPGYVAERNLHIQAQIPGIDDIEGDTVTVLPDVPMSFSFAKKDERIEAMEGNMDPTRATLYDRYGNIPYNATGYSLVLHIPDEYKKYATLSGTGYAFSGGILDFDIGATSLPGKAYIVGSVLPKLESNSFTVTDKSDKTLTISGVSDNITTLDTYYVFNKSKLDLMRYDAQYSVLLGGDYGNISEPGYLGGEILFNHDSKSLAVTTLLNNPWKEQDLFGFTPAGKYTYVKATDDTESLQTTVADNREKNYIAFYDSARKEYIARAWLNIDPDATSFLPCTSSGSDISNCPISSQTTVFLKGFDGNNAVSENTWLTLYSASKIPLLRIDTNGKMEKYPGVEFELDDKTVSNLLGIRLVSNGAQVGYVGIKFASDSIESVSSSELDAALRNNKNRIILETLSNRYISHKTHLGISSNGSEGIMFAFRDASIGEIGNLDPAYTTKSGLSGLEDYPKKAGIGWEDTNRTLLEAAAGITIGNATKFYQTYSTITLGDAVSHLPRVSTTSNFDRTIGTQISQGKGERIESYKKIDANGDGVPDLVIFYESGKIQLLMNYNGSFKDMGYLAYISDGGKLRKGVGDFFGDGYDDIVLTDTKWKLIVLDNTEGKFTRTSPVIVNESGAPDSIHGQIEQMEIFDMDADGKMDLVTLDDSGEMNILYGTERVNAWKKEHVFTKKLIEGGLAIHLSREMRNDGGAFSYKGLVFPDQNTDPTGKTTNLDGMTGAINQGMIDNLIYRQISYQSDSDNRTPEQKKDAAIRASVGSNMKRNPDGTYATDADGNYIIDAGNVPYNTLSGSSLTGRIDYNNASQDTVLAADISRMVEETRRIAGSGNTDFSALDNSTRGDSKRTFIQSPFAEGKGLKVEKVYEIMSGTPGDILRSGDKVRVEIRLTNVSGKTFNDAVYLDSNERKLFQEEQDGVYTLVRNKEDKEEHKLKYLTEGDFDYGFDFANIAPGETIKIQYMLTATPTAFGEMKVGLLEKGEAGDDKYGDISLSPNNMCGGELMMWRSKANNSPLPEGCSEGVECSRNYEKGTKKFVDKSELPEELKKNAVDLDKNGIPDYIDELMKSGKNGDTAPLQQYSNEQLGKYNADADKNNVPDRGDSKGTKVIAYNPSNRNIEIGGLNSMNIDAIDSQIDSVVRWLGCGFGGGACLSSPLNWAPLAPGSTPTAFGFPLGTLTPNTGLPVYSALTWVPLYGPWGCIPVPSVWPVSPLAYEGACAGIPSAGGILGTWSPTNVFRFFITPTITGAIGVAACFGGPAIGVGNIPPPWVSPFIPWGNCVVGATPLLGCKDDGSDGDAGSLGLGMDSNNPYVNANACVQAKDNTVLLPNDRVNIMKYVAGDNAHLPEISASMARWGLSSLSSGPLIGIGRASGEASNFEVSLDATALKNFDVGNILKIKNSRVSAFPDFLMDWATRQLEEVANKLASLPTLYIVLPDFSGFDLSGYKDFPNAFSRGKANDKQDYATGLKSDYQASNKTVGSVQGGYNSLVSDNADTINSLGKNVSGIKAAYEFMSHLPLLKLNNEMVDIAVPMMSPEEADKWLINAKLTLAQWKKEFADKSEKWSRLKNLSEADKKVMVQAEGLIGTLQENITIIEDYKRFPEKLQKYLTWKERYASQLLCNVEAIEFMMGGWISDNGKRFRTWVELYILIKAILKSWQLIVDLFYGFEAECSVCRNERYDLKHFIFKIISAVIPKIPIIQFPKWPDIWLDLHNIRGGLRILMPEYHFNFVPIILPQLPRLALPAVPTLNIGLPQLPLIPRLPNLPNLPDLPSLPNIKLPDLPPPPTIPKLFGAIAAVLQILKLVAKILCILRINPFVPEWRAGDQIAQITERQGKSPLDYINLEFPNFPLSFVDAIKMGSFVNLEFDIDFITAMSRAALSPVNQFTNDLSNIGSVTVPDVNLQKNVPGQINATLDPQAYHFPGSKKTTKDEMMAVLLQKLSFGVLHNFIALNAYMEKHSREEVTVQGLKDILAENVQTIRAMHDPKALAIVDTLQKAVAYKGESETKFIQDMTNQNTEKFRLLKDYIKGEKMETTRLKTEMDNMLRTGTMTRATTPSFLSIGGENIKALSLSTDVWMGDDMKQKILATNDRILPSLENIKSGRRDPQVQEIQDMSRSLVTGVQSGLASFARDMKRNDDIHSLAYVQSMNKLLSINASETNTPIADPTAVSQMTSGISSSASKYRYEGIYILDKNNKQVRLFDYTDGVDGKEELVYSDVDQDGDDDIIYRMDNSLYLKQNFLKDTEASHFSDSPKVRDWQDFLSMSSNDGVLRILAAPNYFEETFTASNEIDFSFRAANPLSDNLFRLEYSDYIDRFDRILSGENPLSIHPNTAAHKVDLIPELPNETVFDTTHTGFVGRKNTVSFGRGSGETVVTMDEYQYITPDTNGTNPIIIARGRTVYTDVGGATISYIRDGETEEKTLSFDKNTNYEFLANTKIWVKSGKLYLFKQSQEQKQINAGDLYGMPVPPGTKVEIADKSSFLGFSYHDGSVMRLDGPGTYEYYPLWQKSKEYTVSLAAPNDWYYARLFSIEKNRNSTAASLHLLSPQRQADTGGPLITYGDAIRVPVYQKQTLSLATYIDDISWVDKVWVDADLTRDTDGDGDMKNDKDSLDSGTRYGIKRGNAVSDLIIGPFDTLFTKKVRLFAEDGNGNISSKDITLTVYPPVPDIKTLSGNIVSGSLNEILWDEPIDVFRLRNGVLSRIDPIGSGSIKTADNGTFSLTVKGTEGIVLTSSGKTIATIDERTGKIELSDTSYQVAVVPASSGSPLQIQVLSPDKKTVFSESINISAVSNIAEVPDLGHTIGTGIFIAPTAGFSFAKNTASSPNLPNGGYITDTSHRAVAGISKWGDIYLLDPKYSLSYATKDSYIIIRILDSEKNVVANVLYRINAEYVMK